MSSNRFISLRLSLLDCQIVDRDRLPVGRVDDVELAIGEPGVEPEIRRLEVGARPLGARIGGLAGRLMSVASARLAHGGAGSGGPGIDPGLICEIRPMVRLEAEFDELEGVAGLERWLRSRVIRRLPGMGDASE